MAGEIITLASGIFFFITNVSLNLPYLDCWLIIAFFVPDKSDKRVLLLLLSAVEGPLHEEVPRGEVLIY